jgi:acetyl esterase/lipase
MVSLAHRSRAPRSSPPRLFIALAVLIIVGSAVGAYVYSRTRGAVVTYNLQTVTYCSPGHVAQLMDIYSPTTESGASMPVVEMVHGGGWTGGDRGPLDAIDPVPEVPAAMRGLLAAGFVVTSIEYRLAPHYRFPASIVDVKCSIRYLRAHAAQYNIDPQRIGLMGSSAGGHLVSLAGLAGPSAGWDHGEYADQSSAV